MNAMPSKPPRPTDILKTASLERIAAEVYSDLYDYPYIRGTATVWVNNLSPEPPTGDKMENGTNNYVHTYPFGQTATFPQPNTLGTLTYTHSNPELDTLRRQVFSMQSLIDAQAAFIKQLMDTRVP